jgi:hypothetical protein
MILVRLDEKKVHCQYGFLSFVQQVMSYIARLRIILLWTNRLAFRITEMQLVKGGLEFKMTGHSAMNREGFTVLTDIRRIVQMKALKIESTVLFVKERLPYK